jgi:hypothetical protein
VRPFRLALAVLVLATAAFAALLASDLRGWHDAVRAGDVEFARGPADARWGATTVLPFDPALRILDLSGQLAFRQAARAFVGVEASGNGIDNGYSETRARGALEGVLASLAQGPDRRLDSAAENLLGILAFKDSQQRGPSAPAPVDVSVADFQAAVELDPTNQEAKFNLELLLRRLLAQGVRPGSNGASSAPTKGHRGAGGGSPGRGY